RAASAGATPAPADATGGSAGVALPAGLAKPKRPARLEYSAPTIDGAGGGVEHRAETGATGGGDFARVGRNEPCPCGSGRKFKRCHGDPRTRAAT
ncbi:MAG TPA: SEC-C metal-binding domain-containing protein, partial [Streptosporangiaceae bacterium]|nr:SEC-C metal-binding domain-containing protein [Streptosporangiaceae bacterium]